jgi:hypothetical protein
MNNDRADAARKMTEPASPNNNTQDSESEEDPQIFVEDFYDTTMEMLKESNVIRRPSFVTRGPN